MRDLEIRSTECGTTFQSGLVSKGLVDIRLLSQLLASMTMSTFRTVHIAVRKGSCVTDDETVLCGKSVLDP